METALRATGWLAAILALQAGLLPALAGAWRPDLLRVFAILAGFLTSERIGLGAGAAAGLAADLLGGRLLGFHTLLDGAAGWIGARAGRQLVRDPFLALLLVAGIVTVQDAGSFLLLRLEGLPIPLARALGYVTLPGLLADLASVLPLYLLLARFLAPRPPLTGNIESLPPRALRAHRR